jgi:hypothetical protein
MRRPKLSTGAWIFTGLVTAAVLAPVGVYAATSTVTIGNATGTTTAKVTSNQQLLTTNVLPGNVVNIASSVGSECDPIYTPPTGKGIVVTNATFSLGTGTAGQESYATLGEGDGTDAFDQFDTSQAFETEQHTYPTGLPMRSIGSCNLADVPVYVSIQGYLVPAAQLPPVAAGAAAGAKATRLR